MANRHHDYHFLSPKISNHLASSLFQVTIWLVSVAETTDAEPFVDINDIFRMRAFFEDLQTAAGKRHSGLRVHVSFMRLCHIVEDVLLFSLVTSLDIL